ncbi:MAG: hypothetical protein A2583_16510 [Bdellovibrionales bacterium RIFOXYD1_FULL_53_11]|nr:MAG: hypothetical protein A2583_16510 [Bdellovibrionales bacterium RIFOXYD1_FULL_53_11]
MALGKRKLQNLKDQLLNRKREIATQLEKVKADIKDDTSFRDAIDQASADVDRAFGLQMKYRNMRLIGEIDDALKRIEGGSFGECVHCGGDISEARLLANPATTLCIDCKAEIESDTGRMAVR